MEWRIKCILRLHHVSVTLSPKCRSCAHAASAAASDGGASIGALSAVEMTSATETSRSANKDGKHTPYHSV